MDSFGQFAMFVTVLVFLLVFAGLSIRIVSPYEKGLVVRLGRFQRTAESGLTMIAPFIESMFKVDMRERVIDVLPQEVITKDNVVVTVDAVLYCQISDPVKASFNVQNFIYAATKLAQTNLRNLVGDLELDQSLVSREQINAKLRHILDDATDKWGVRVGRVEIQRIEPPADVTNAMHRQMKAEREKRAVILEAEGARQSAILQSEGIRQSKMLNAEGEAGAIQRVADAEKYRRLTVAEGEAQAIERIYQAIHTGNPTNDVIAIRYLETLQRIAEGPANKVFIPYEAAGLMGSLGGIAELFKESKGPTRVAEAPAQTVSPAADSTPKAQTTG
jgi:regulator of protease activity HflC (stomatin/prohibitin superfamily)